MRFTVTGAAGFVGQALVRELLAAGADVTTVDRRRVGVPGCLGSLITELRTDLLDPDGRRDLAQALADSDAVVHLAAAPGVRDDRAGVAQRRDRDTVQTARLVCELTPAATPLVVLSSSSVYGPAPGRPSRETDSVAPQGGYARSKVAVEDACGARAEHGRVLVVRPFTLLGTGQRADMAVSRWAAAMLRDEPVIVYGSLDRTRDWTCARQAARAVRELAERGATGTVNVGSGRPRPLRDVIAALERALGRHARVRVEPAARREVVDTWADTSRLRALLGWAPETDLDAVVGHAALAADPWLEPVS